MKKGYHVICSDCKNTFHANTHEGQILLMQWHDGRGHDFYMPLEKDDCGVACG
jgi:hypothetical protein